MIVYFTASIAGKKHYLDCYQYLISVLKRKSEKVICEHIMDTKLSQVRLETKDERLSFHKKLEKWIGSCDFVVVETTFPSISVGYEISLALQLGKPVLMLYCDGYPPSLLAQSNNDQLVCERYDKNNLSDVINDFINYISSTFDTRFTFFITPDIAKYLEKKARKERMPKSVYLRKLIEKDKTNSPS